MWSGLKKTEATRLFNDVRANVEPYFACEDFGTKPVRRTKNQSRAVPAAQTVIDNRRSLRWTGNMKTPRFILALLALTVALAPQLPKAAFAQPYKPGYRAKLLSPRPGQVLVPGQVVRIAWTAEYPDVDITMCETEILLSIDGGRTTYMRLTESRNPTVQYFDWVVPNAPTNTAVLNIRFGCLNIFPETPSLQLQSAFVISPPVNK
jgi:hypothetical protein